MIGRPGIAPEMVQTFQLFFDLDADSDLVTQTWPDLQETLYHYLISLEPGDDAGAVVKAGRMMTTEEYSALPEWTGP